MAITTQEEKKNKIFTPTFKRNWKLFKQSTMGKVGLIIISFFGILATIQPLFFISGYWSESVYDPVVGYDPIEVTLLIVKCPKNEEYPTESRMGLLIFCDFSNASCPHGYQSTGLNWC